MTTSSPTPACTNRHWQSLYNTALSLTLARNHAVVDRKVPADEISTRCGCIPSELVSLVLCIACVFAIVNTDGACVVASPGAETLVNWIRPMTALAEA